MIQNTEHIAVALLIVVTFAQALKIRSLRKLIAPFDHGKRDGKPGG